MVIAPTVWIFLGWRSGSSLAVACRDAAEGLPGDLGTIDFLQVLKATRASVESWEELEKTLSHIASRPEPKEGISAMLASLEEERWGCAHMGGRMPNAASVLHYAKALAAMQILPQMTQKLVVAVQAGLDEAWPNAEQRLTKPWIACVLSHLQHNSFEDFAASINQKKTPLPTVFAVCCELTQTAVAAGELVDEVRWWQDNSDT